MKEKLANMYECNFYKQLTHTHTTYFYTLGFRSRISLKVPPTQFLYKHGVICTPYIQAHGFNRVALHRHWLFNFTIRLQLLLLLLLGRVWHQHVCIFIFIVSVSLCAMWVCFVGVDNVCEDGEDLGGEAVEISYDGELDACFALV